MPWQLWATVGNSAQYPVTNPFLSKAMISFPSTAVECQQVFYLAVAVFYLSIVNVVSPLGSKYIDHITWSYLGHVQISGDEAQDCNSLQGSNSKPWVERGTDR